MSRCPSASAASAADIQTPAAAHATTSFNARILVFTAAPILATFK
jgi:hypothetical protein